MAFTGTILKRTVHGDERVVHYLVTADNTSGSVNTGLGNIVAIQSTVKSMATYTTFGAKANFVGASTASAGYVHFHGTSSGDELYLTVYGR